MKSQVSGLAAVVIALCIAMGLFAVGLLGIAIVIPYIPQPSSSPRVDKSLHFDFEGNPVVMANHYSSHSGLDRIWEDLDGNPLSDFNDARLLNFTVLSQPLIQTEPWYLEPDLRSRLPRIFTGKEHWYSMPLGQANDRHILSGYDIDSKLHIGFFGTTGFSKNPLPLAEAFQISLTGRSLAFRTIHSPHDHIFYLLADDDNVYKIDTLEMKTRIVFRAPSLVTGSFYYLPKSDSGKNPHVNETWLVVRTQDEILFLNHDYEIVKQWSIPDHMKDRLLMAALTPSNHFVAYSERTIRPPSEGRHSSEGRYELFKEESNSIETSSIRLDHRVRGIEVLPAIGLVAFPPLLVSSVMTAAYVSSSGTVTSQLDPMLFWQQWLQVLILGILIIVLAGLTIWHQQRVSTRWMGRIFWPIFVFLLGVPGYLGYRLHRRWPVLEECPACHNKAPMDRLQCAHCGAEFPPPALTGAEIVA